ncbi:MAG TPA: glycosyltransferase family 2 protein [Armatimonadota bacterium]|nr:glycosyltransferase family 2 protein [Armatimonadota bacterium]
MGSSAQVTVGIPTIGREYLRDAIESLLAQSFTDWHGIISDNSNSPEVRTLVESYGDKRLEYVGHPHNLGSGGNFNYIFDVATSEYCTILHDDDRYHQDYLQQMLAGFHEFPQARWAFCNAWNYIDGTETKLSWFSEMASCVFEAKKALFTRLVGENCICCPTVIFHRDVYAHYKFNLIYPQSLDWEMWIRLAYDFDAFYLGEQLLYYRSWSESASSMYQLNGELLLDDVALLAWVTAFNLPAEIKKKIIRERKHRIRKLCRRIIKNECKMDVAKLSVLFSYDRGFYITLLHWAYRYPLIRSALKRWVDGYDLRRQSKKKQKQRIARCKLP